MLAYTYIFPGKFELIDKPKPELQNPRDAIVRITLSSICTSDLHIKHGSVPRAVPVLDNWTVYASYRAHAKRMARADKVA